jgi:ProP effector
MKVGIHEDILAAGFPEAGLRRAPRIYTGNGNYLFALRPGAPRVDLDGNMAGVVSEEAALVAAAELSRRKARNQARREAPTLGAGASGDQGKSSSTEETVAC